MNHTPEPWCLYDSEKRYPGIEAGDFSVVIWGDKNEDAGVRGDTKKLAYANAQRIVDCVNACAGIENPAETIKELLEALERLTSQMMIADNDHDITVRVFQMPTGEVRKARAAIAKVKGEQL